MDNIRKVKEVLRDSKIKVNGITLDLDNKVHIGVNKLSNIKWLNYKFDKTFNELYGGINLMFFRVNEKALENSIKCILNSGRGVSFLKVPHIDGRTGNIHPGKDYVDSFGRNKVEQLVLINTSKIDPGPKTEKLAQKEDVYDYLPIHKSCYFPRIDGSAPKDDARYNFLKEVCEKIYEWNKQYNKCQKFENKVNILSDEILKEIGKYEET